MVVRDLDHVISALVVIFLVLVDRQSVPRVELFNYLESRIVHHLDPTEPVGEMICGERRIGNSEQVPGVPPSEAPDELVPEFLGKGMPEGELKSRSVGNILDRLVELIEVVACNYRGVDGLLAGIPCEFPFVRVIVRVDHVPSLGILPSGEVLVSIEERAGGISQETGLDGHCSRLCSPSELGIPRPDIIRKCLALDNLV